MEQENRIKKNIINMVSTLLVPVLLLGGCEKDNTEPGDNLSEIGLLGLWKLEMRTVNGISGLTTECCDFLEFISDGNDNGFGGEFVASGVGYGTQGLFELNTSQDSINFTYGDNKRTYGFRIEEEVISFSYLDNDQKITETWRKEE